jgi:hypothetical protein
MRSAVIAVAFVVGMVGTASAGDLQISADAPIAGLPAISKDGGWFARQVRVQPTGCKGVQTFVEIGSVGSPDLEAKGSLLLVRDDCDSGGASQIEKNVAKVNDTMRDKGFASVGKVDARSLPTTLDTGEGKLEVSSSGSKSFTVAIAGSKVDRWTIQLQGTPIEVRAWYGARNKSGTGYVAVLIASEASDTGERGRERWVDLWPVGARFPQGDDSPVDVVARFVAALKKQDTTGVAQGLSAPFWKVGLAPVSGKDARRCKKKHTAKRERDLGTIARCIVAAGELYRKLADADAIAEMDLSELPAELRKHKKKVKKLVRDGAKLVRYHVNDDGYYVFLIFVLDPDTDFQTANAILESVDVDQ